MTMDAATPRSVNCLNASWLASSMTKDMRARVLAKLLESLTAEECRVLNADWRFWSRDEQSPPEDRDWTTWLFLGGRGAGKTRAGAEWLRREIEDNGCGRI